MELKNFTIFPIEVCGRLSPRELYVLAGLYINAHYVRDDEYMTTDTTFSQLSETTGVSVDYIKKSFVPKLKSLKDIGISVTSIQESYKVKRNIYKLPNPKSNYRIIWKELFSDKTLLPEEKGMMIGLYCLCVNNEFRIDLLDKTICEKLKITRNTLKKYIDLLIDKKIIWSSEDAPIALISFNHDNARIIMYPHLGYATWLDKVNNYIQDEYDEEAYCFTFESA